MSDHTQRFTGRAGDYALGRPSYPDRIVDHLEACGLAPGSLVADIGAGTGLSSRLFLDRGYNVVAVEPNADMRAAAIGSGIDCRDGTGEATGLKAACFDLVLCAQAFHWMDRERAWSEFRRIARPGGLLALVWNLRLASGSPFMEGLESLFARYSTELHRRREASEFRSWPGTTEARFDNTQRLDWPALRARVTSTSYMPRHSEAMLADLRALFDQTIDAGFVSMLYDCRLYWALNG